MRIVRTVDDLRRALCGFPPEAVPGAPPPDPVNWRAMDRTVGLVPTMGALHDGHLALARRAAADVDVVVMSIFVNPTQFNDPADLAAYPRDEDADAALAGAAGVDLLFVPAPAEVYPPGFSASVQLYGALVDSLEGTHRGAGHFRGVTTVVTKLLGMASPDLAYFGQKDAQQARVIRALVRDLNIPTRIVTVPTVREPDGLAMSSRNRRLGPDHRAQAAGLYAALSAARGRAAAGERDAATLLAAAWEVLGAARIAPEYVVIVDPDTFEPLATLGAGEALLAIAAEIGGTRLIDNVIIGGA